jgi:nitrogen fixation NifU-like protein
MKKIIFILNKNRRYMAYNELIIKHYEKPSNVGSLDKNDPNVGTALKGAPACGDVIKFQIQVEKKNESSNDSFNEEDYIIKDAKFKTFGCGSAIASSSLLTEMVKGKSFKEAMQIKNSDIAQELALPPVKWHCSVLAESAIKGAIEDFQTKQMNFKYGIQITMSALNQIEKIFKDNSENAKYIIFLAKNGGCSGKKYDIKLEKNIDHNFGHLKLINEKNLNIIIDKDSLDLFKNMEIDFLENSLGSKFIFNNPSAENTCGCGESFG